jgi:hypothetical protein
MLGLSCSNKEKQYNGWNEFTWGMTLNKVKQIVDDKTNMSEADTDDAILDVPNEFHTYKDLYFVDKDLIRYHAKFNDGSDVFFYFYNDKLCKITNESLQLMNWNKLITKLKEKYGGKVIKKDYKTQYISQSRNLVVTCDTLVSYIINYYDPSLVNKLHKKKMKKEQQRTNDKL